jgi:hypothetical protein
MTNLGLLAPPTPSGALPPFLGRRLGNGRALLVGGRFFGAKPLWPRSRNQWEKPSRRGVRSSSDKLLQGLAAAYALGGRRFALAGPVALA